VNRRELIAAMVALPAITSIARADVAPSDTIVVECDGPVSPDDIGRIQSTLRQAFPGTEKILVLAAGLHLKVVRGVQ
jgi:hypothetical protein